MGTARALEQALRSGEGKRIVEVARQALRARWGERLVDIDALRGQAAASHTTEESEAGGDGEDVTIDRFGFPAGDLDGDGLDDVFSYELARSGGEIVRDDLLGVRGTDGAELWRLDLRDAAALFLMTGSDLTGDGSPDLLLLGTGQPGRIVGCVFVSGPHGVCPPSAWDVSFEWEVRALSGRDGEPLWRLVEAGRLQDVLAYPASAGDSYVWQAEVTGILTYPYEAGDLDGDGGSDIVLNTYDARWTSAVAPVAWGGTFESRSHQRVLSGSRATPLFERMTEYESALEELLPAGSLAGGATPDLLRVRWDWPDAAVAACVPVRCADTWRVAFDYEAIDGQTLEAAWSGRLDGDLWDVYVWPQVADLDADGRDDILVEEIPPGEPNRLAAASGASGAILWRRDAAHSGWGWLEAIGPLGGEAGDDLLLAESEDLADPADGADWYLSRLDGATGATMGSVRELGWRAETGGSYLPYLTGVVPDVNGDGAADILLETVDLGPSGHPVRMRATIESTGGWQALLSLERAGWTSFEVPGDLDADGVPDLVIEQFNDQYWVWTWEAIAIPSGRVLFARSYAAASLYASGDTNGTGNEIDFIFSLSGWADGHELGAVEAVEGSDGTTTWVRGDEVAQTPGSSGVIVGRVTGGGEPLAGACVGASGPIEDPYGGDWWGDTKARADGSFTLSRLPLGSFWVHVRDCATNRFLAAFYPGVISFEDAEPVVVAAGATSDVGEIALTLAPKPANDDRQGATPISSLPFAASGTTVGATLEPGEPVHCAGVTSTVWFRFDAQAAEYVEVRLYPGSRLAVYAGTALGPALGVACETRALIAVVPGVVYWLQVGSTSESADSFDLAMARVFP